MTPIAAGPLRLTLGAVLGVGTALLVACGASSSQLIPVGNAGHLQSDFDAIASSVKGGDCTATRRGVQQAQLDLAALPGTVNPRLLGTLTTGVHTLAARAGTDCKLNAVPAKTTTGQTSTPTQTNTSANTNPTNTNASTRPTDTNTLPTNTNTSPNTTPADITSTPATTVPGSTGPVPGGAGGTQAPGQSQSSPSGSSGGTPGGGN